MTEFIKDSVVRIQKSEKQHFGIENFNYNKSDKIYRECNMKRASVLKILAENREKIKEFAVEDIAVFGSVARDEATDDSDVDILVDFQPGEVVGLFRFVRLKHFLEDILGCQVDITTR